MDNNKYKNLEALGHITSEISRAKNIDEAIAAGIHIIINECSVDYAAVWVEDVKGDSILHPQYWICPVDLTVKEHRRGEGCVGRVYRDQQSEQYSEYKPGDDTETEKDFEGIEIGSMICVPLSGRNKKIGSIQFINKKGSPCFTDEDRDIFEMFVTLIAINIETIESQSKAKEEKKEILTVRGLHKSFRSGESMSHILKGVNLNIYEGEFVILLGESGCGKSTLLNIMGGLDKADEGQLIFKGKDLLNATEEELTAYRRDNLGFVFQSYNLMPNLNARENVDLIAEMVDNPMDSVEALNLVNLGNKLNSYPSALSGGQQQRIAIARALVKKPGIIMADEPTAALDYETSITVLEVFEEIKKLGTTLIMVTHNEEIAKMADRVIKLRNGRMYEVKRNIFPLKAKELIW